MKGVLLINYGGPNGPLDVKEYLKNIFMDQAVLPLHRHLRKIFAVILSNYRKNYSTKQYEKIGYGKLLEITKKQAEKLEEISGFKTYIGMMYFTPYIHEAVKAAKNDGITHITAIPLFPQYSITTSYSAYLMLMNSAGDMKIKFVRSFPENEKFIESFIDNINEELAKFSKKPFLIFSAHGVPDNEVDTYKYEVILTVSKIMEKLGSFEYITSFQSKVGPLKWLEPNTIDVVREISKSHGYLLLIPVSFVSDNLETLYELGILNREVAMNNGAKEYRVVKCPNDSEKFISGLKDLI